MRPIPRVLDFPRPRRILQPPQLHWLPTSVSKKVGCRRVSPPASARFAMGNAPSSEGPTTSAAQKAGWPESDDASGAHRGVDSGYVVKCFARECTPAFALRPPATQADVQLISCIDDRSYWRNRPPSSRRRNGATIPAPTHWHAGRGRRIYKAGDKALRLNVDGLNGFAAMMATMKEMGMQPASASTSVLLHQPPCRHCTSC